MDLQFDNIKDFYYDINEADLRSIDKWKFGRLKNKHLSNKTFRTYHPNHLNRASYKILTKKQKDFILEYLKMHIY